MTTMNQRARTRTQQQQQGDVLTPAQLSAYRQTGVTMSDTEATAYLLSKLSTPQLRALHRQHVTHKASAFLAPCGGYADTGSDMLDSNFANLRDLPEPLRATSALQADAIARTDAELAEFVGAVLRSRWTKAAAVALACTATLLVLTGCGGGAAPADRFEPSLAAPAAQQATAPALSVLIVGDSTMTPVYPGEASTPDIVQQLLPGDRITNAAVSGTTACQADLQAIRTAHVDVVVANYGINDAYGNASAPRHNLTDYAACLSAIADAARDAGSALVMLEANPILPSPGWDPARIADYNQVKRATGGAYYCAQPAIRWTSAELPDGQHPAAPAKPAIAAALVRCIRNAL